MIPSQRFSHKRRSPLVVALASTLVLFNAGPGFGCADGLACAAVRESADGFVAMRATPDSKGMLIAKLAPYEIIHVLRSDCRPHTDEDPWSLVVCVPSLDEECPAGQGKTQGWVSTRLIAVSPCPVNPD